MVNIIVEKCKKENISYTFVERKSGYHQTKEALNKKIDVVFQPQVKDWNNNIVGYPDIIVKKKAFLKLFKFSLDNIPDDEYVVIDIKFSSVKSDEKSYVLETSNYIKYIKGQISMYSRLLKSISPVGFIISKDKSTIEHPIAVNVKDKELVKVCDDAINWLKLLYQKGKDLDISNLKANLNNTMDGYWREYKKELFLPSNEEENLTIKKENIAYLTKINCNKFDLHLPVKQYTVAVMVKIKDKIFFNITTDFSDENLLATLELGNLTVISSDKQYIDPPRKGTIKTDLEITAVYNRGKLSDEIIHGIVNYCLENCNELEKRYNLI